MKENNDLCRVSDEELEKIVGGAETSGQQIVLHYSYTCPFCNQKHTFDGIMDRIGVNFNMDIFNTDDVCPSTGTIGYVGSNYFHIYDKNGTFWDVYCHADGTTVLN